MLDSTSRLIPSSRSGASIALHIRSARLVAAITSVVSGESTPNSSPPIRATVSLARTVSRNRSATSCSSTSPAWWPSVSLISLKRSRSSTMIASDELERSAASTACSIRSLSSVRFGRSVRSSCSAWCWIVPICDRSRCVIRRSSGMNMRKTTSITIWSTAAIGMKARRAACAIGA